MTETPADLILSHLVAIRREIGALREWQEAHGRQLAQLTERVGGLEKRLIDVQSEQVLIDNKLLTRHNEILETVRRLERLEGIA